MASETATALAVRKEEAVEVVDAKPCPDMLALMADAKAAEKLVPWTDEEIEKATLAELGERVRLVCSHFKLAIISEHDFVMRFRKEFRALREKSRQQGRRLPIPGCPDWTELKKMYFTMSSRQIDRLLEDPDKPKAEREPKPQPETKPEPDGPTPEVLVPDQPLPPTEAEVTEVVAVLAEDQGEESEAQAPIDDDEDTLSAMVGCWRDLFGGKPEPERAAAIHSFFSSLGEEYRDDILSAAKMLALGRKAQLENKVGVLEHARAVMEGKRGAGGGGIAALAEAADILQESEPEMAASFRNAIAPFMEEANAADGEATAASPAVQSVEYRRERVSEILEALREAKDAQESEPDEAKRHAIRDAAEDKAYVATKELILASTRGKVQAALTKALPREERWTLLDSPISHALSDSRAEFKYQELPSEQYKRLAREDAERAHLWKAGEGMPESLGTGTGAGTA
jgi:hypothetical protein